MAWTDKARQAAAAARKRNAKFGNRGYGVSGAKLAPKRLGTVVDTGRVSKKAYNREHAIGAKLRRIQSRAMFQELRGKLISAVGRNAQVKHWERKESKAVAIRRKLNSWGSPNTYALPKGTPMNARRSVRNGATQSRVSRRYSK